jgi:hypothetical protein
MTWLAVLLLACQPVPQGECSALGQVIVFDDDDGDGFGDPATERSACELAPSTTTVAGDCDDQDPSSFPDAAEQCDGADNDCDTDIDEEMPLKTWYSDYDQDGVGNADYPEQACAQPEGTALEAGDCDDTDPDVSPFGIEVCNGLDDDCDNRTDDEDPSVDPSTWATFWNDADGDGAGDPLAPVLGCAAPVNAVDNADDCDDGNAAIAPGAGEICNGEDDDCDGLWEESDPDLDPDELVRWWYDGDGDGTGDDTIWEETCAPPLFYVGNDDDCDDAEPLLSAPAPWLVDTDGDGYGAGAPSAASCTPPAADWVVAAAGVDCDPVDPLVHPDAADPCGDDTDQDCNGFDDFCTVGIAETCAEAQVQPHATTGVWPVSASLLADDLDVTPGQCTPTGTNGREGFVQIDLGPLEVATIVHTGNADASPYVLTDCAVGASCVGGAENESIDGTTETLRWQNATLADTTIFAVFDCADGSCTDASGQIEVSATPLLADTCAEAETWTPLGTGSMSLYGSVAAFTDDLDLPMNGCTGFQSPGKEGFLPVVVAPGETLEVGYKQLVQDASIYFLTDCAAASSCVQGKDTTFGGELERTAWTNPGGTDEVIYIAFDCYSAGCSDFSATVELY